MTHECVTHHKACDCREAEHQFQIEKRDREIELLQRISARYKWLIKYAYIGECHTEKGTVFDVQNSDRVVPIKSSVDEAIDAAMAQSPNV